MSRLTLWLALGGLLLTGCQSTAPRTVTTRTLLHEMTDLRQLAEMPDPVFTCTQFSSYDRRSVSPDQGGPPTEGWFANADAGNFLREEQIDGRTEYVMVDAAGPGAIVRIWSANPAGTLRIYLDGAAEPTLALPLEDFLKGRLPDWPKPITGQRSRGCNSYFPIPYAKHCKVTCDTNEFYYHVNVRTYPSGTPVQTFTPELLETARPQIAQLAADLTTPRQVGRHPQQGWEPAASLAGYTLQPGATRTLANLRGSGAISALYARLAAPDIEAALRETVLTIRFDGELCVHSPLGDFFGSAPGLAPYESLPMGITMDGVLWSHWLMPFAKQAEVTLQNLGDAPIDISCELYRVKRPWTDRSMHFHAKWRRDNDVPTRPMIDWNYLTVDGAGVFVGAAFNIGNPLRNWWGEGDEKIYVDGETFPSTFGTGTEDYFGYAWCDNAPFTHAYHNQPRCDGPGNYGFTSNNRWHIIDQIPFTKNFKFDMELWHWNEECVVDMAITSYWYQRPGGSDGFATLAAADVDYEPMPRYIMFKVPGAIEGEELEVLAKRDEARVDPHSMKGASADETLLYHYDTAEGDRLVLGFDVPEDGRYRVFARFVKSRDFGIVQWSLNDTPAGDPIDFFDPEPMLMDEIELGVFTLHAGQNRLVADIVGTNEQSLYQRYMLGLDYLRLERVP